MCNKIFFNLLTSGWGKTKIDGNGADVLQEAKMPIVPNDVCGARNVDRDGKSRIVDSMVCGGFQNVNSTVSGCMGDSGGPYVCKKANKWVGNLYTFGNILI